MGSLNMLQQRFENKLRVGLARVEWLDEAQFDAGLIQGAVGDEERAPEANVRRRTAQRPQRQRMANRVDAAQRDLGEFKHAFKPSYSLLHLIDISTDRSQLTLVSQATTFAAGDHTAT